MREYNGGRFVPIPTNESQNNLIAVIDRFTGARVRQRYRGRKRITPESE
jgi:hypothetical protein